MKNLISIMIVALVMLFGCAKDAVTDQNQNPSLKKANVPIPMKGVECMIDDPEDTGFPVAGTPLIHPVTGKQIPQLYVDRHASFSGYATHYGEFIAAKCEMTAVSAYIDIDSLKALKGIIFHTVYESKTVASNGDYTLGTSHTKLNVTNPNHMTIEGTWESTSGTGRFENATGSGTLKGVLPCWELNGTLIYTK